MTERGFYPKAIVKNIPPGSNDPAIIPCGVVLHVRDGLGDSLHDYFNGPSGGIESTVYIRFDGTCEQYRSIFFEADAQLDGNSFFIDGKRVGFVSVETEGRAAGEWTAAQLATIKDFILWVKSEAKAAGFEIPLEECPAWNASGIGYHTMWGSPSHWTPVAKSCPGPDRIKQFNDVIVPWLAEASRPKLPLPVRHRIATANLFVKNKDQSGGLVRLNARVRKAFGWAPDAIGVQEGRGIAVQGYNLFVSDKGEAAREIPVLLRSHLKCLGVEFHHAADGTGDKVFNHPRGIFVVKYLKRRRRVALVNTHMGVFGEARATEGQVGPAALEHAAHAALVGKIVQRLRSNGYTVFVTTDANSNGGWSKSLPAALTAIGMTITQHGPDLIACDPKRVRRPSGVEIVPKAVTGSDAHDGIAIRCTQRRTK